MRKKITAEKVEIVDETNTKEMNDSLKEAEAKTIDELPISLKDKFLKKLGFKKNG